MLRCCLHPLPPPAQTKKKGIDFFGEQAKALKALDKPGAPLGNHVKAVSEALSAFSWVFVDVGPLGIIEAGRDSGEFYANKVRAARSAIIGEVARQTRRGRGL